MMFVKLCLLASVLSVASGVGILSGTAGFIEKWSTGLSNCRNQFYDSSAQMCCNNVLFDIEYQVISTSVVAKTVCCGTATTPVTKSYDANGVETGVCCGNTYYTIQAGKSCCGNNYMEATNQKCCEGTVLSTVGVTDPACCGPTLVSNTFSTDFQCCPTSVEALNDGYTTADSGTNTGISTNFQLEYPVKVLEGMAYNKTDKVCCSNTLSTRVHQSGTTTTQWACCQGSYVSYNKETQFTCGVDAGEDTSGTVKPGFANSRCQIYNKKDNKFCQNTFTTCPLADEQASTCLTCSAKKGKGTGYNPLCELRYNGDSSAATVSASLAVVVAAFAALFL